MKVFVSDATGQLTELVRLAEGSDEVILTRRGHAAVRLVQVTALPTAIVRHALMEKVRAAGAAKARPGPDAARSQDFFYNDDGLPA